MTTTDPRYKADGSEFSNTEMFSELARYRSQNQEGCDALRDALNGVDMLGWPSDRSKQQKWALVNEHAVGTPERSYGMIWIYYQ